MALQQVRQDEHWGRNDAAGESELGAVVVPQAISSARVSISASSSAAALVLALGASAAPALRAALVGAQPCGEVVPPMQSAALPVLRSSSSPSGSGGVPVLAVARSSEATSTSTLSTSTFAGDVVRSLRPRCVVVLDSRPLPSGVVDMNGAEWGVYSVSSTAAAAAQALPPALPRPLMLDGEAAAAVAEAMSLGIPVVGLRALVGPALTSGRDVGRALAEGARAALAGLLPGEGAEGALDVGKEFGARFGEAGRAPRAKAASGQMFA